MKKRHFTCLLLVLGFFCTRAFASTPINPSTDVLYMGAFRLPDLPSGYVWPLHDGAGYNKGGMSFYPPRGSLLAMCGPGKTVATRRYIVEVGIASPKVDNYANLNPGTLFHDPVDIIGKDNAGTYAMLGDVHYYSKQGSQASDKLYVSIYGSYSVASIYSLFNGQFAWADTDLDRLNLKGWWRFDIGSGYVGKYIFHIPTAWADEHVEGKYLLAGYYRGGGSPRLGPTIYAFAPWESCAGANCETDPPPDAEEGAEPKPRGGQPVPPELKYTLPYQTLLEYSGSVGDQTFKNAAPNDKFSNGAWLTVAGKSAVVLYGWKASRAWSDYKWQYPNAPAFIKYVNGGYHDEPGYPALFFYNVDDLAAVAQGAKKPYEPQPYAVVNLLPYFYYKKGITFSTDGMAYDENNNTLYLRESVVGSYEAVHAFRLSDVGKSLDTTPPMEPVVNLDSASHESVTFSWTDCGDDSGKPVVYEIYRNDAPIAFTTSTSFKDDLYAYYPSPVKYEVVARDPIGNTSTGNSIYVDDSNGGNVPISIFISTLGSSSEHETSTALKVRQNTAYSFRPSAIGGFPPYEWSASGLPTGLKIDKVTGEISGNVGRLNAGQWRTPVISVMDSAGNIHRRRTNFSIVSASAKDLDRDGYASIADGGTDEDDTTIMINPLNPTQPAPGGPRIAGRGEGSVILTWSDAAQRQHFGWLPSRNKELDWRLYQGDLTYQVHYGTSPGVYSDKVYVGRAKSCRVSGGSGGTYYFAVTAFSFRGLESGVFNEISVTLDGGSGEISVRPVDWDTGNFVTPSDGSDGETVEVTYEGSSGDIAEVSGGSIEGPSTSDDGTILSQPQDGAINGQAYGAYFVEGRDSTNKIVQTADGGIVLASFTSSYAWKSAPADFMEERDNKALGRLLLVKADANGVEQWRRVAGPEGYNISSKQIGSTVHWVATGIIQTGTDDLFVSGYRGTSDSDTGSFTGIDGFLMKFDRDGDIVWDRSINGSGTSNDFPMDVLDRDGGGFAVAGYSNRAGDTDVWLVLTDGKGQKAAQHCYKANGKGYEVARAIRKTSDGGFIMAGWTQTGGNPDEDYYVVKTSSDGTLQWAQRYDYDGRRDKAYGIEEDDSGNFWVFGRSQKPGAENTRIWMLKLNSQGVYQPSYEIGDYVDANAYVCRGSLKLANGNFLIIGYTNVTGGQGYNGYVAEISTSGEMVGMPNVVGADASRSEDYLFSGVVSEDGMSYLLAGTNNGAFSTGYDLWYLKLSTADKSVQNFTSCPSKITYYYDKDLDGLGNNDYWQPPTANVCVEMPGYVLNADDPDDTIPSAASGQ